MCQVLDLDISPIWNSDVFVCHQTKLKADLSSVSWAWPVPVCLGSREWSVHCLKSLGYYVRREKKKKKSYLVFQQGWIPDLIKPSLILRSYPIIQFLIGGRPDLFYRINDVNVYLSRRRGHHIFKDYLWGLYISLVKFPQQIGIDVAT